MKKLTKYITFICMICMLCIPVHAKTLTVKLPKKTVKQTMSVGKKLSLKVKYKGKIVTKKVKFSSSKKSVATVSKKGVIKAKKVGKAIITLKYKVKKKTYVSRITLKVIRPVKSVRLDKEVLYMRVGDKVPLNATVSPSNATTKTLTWSSLNNRVATVSGGTVEAKSKGSAIIIVKTKSGGKTDCCYVYVEEKEPVYASTQNTNAGNTGENNRTSTTGNGGNESNTPQGGTNGGNTTTEQSDLPFRDEYGYMYYDKAIVNGITFYAGLFQSNGILSIYSKQTFDREKFSIKIGDGNAQFLGVEDPEYEFLGEKTIQMYGEHYVYPDAKNPVAFIHTENPDYRKKLFPGWKYYSIYLTFVRLDKEVPIEVYYDGNLVYKKNVTGKEIEELNVKNLNYYKRLISGFTPSENAKTFADELLELCGYIYKTVTYEELDCKGGAFIIYWYAAEHGYKARYYYWNASGVYGYGHNDAARIPGHTGCQVYLDGEWHEFETNGHHDGEYIW